MEIWKKMWVGVFFEHSVQILSTKTIIYITKHLTINFTAVSRKHTLMQQYLNTSGKTFRVSIIIWSVYYICDIYVFDELK